MFKIQADPFEPMVFVIKDFLNVKNDIGHKKGNIATKRQVCALKIDKQMITSFAIFYCQKTSDSICISI